MLDENLPDGVLEEYFEKEFKEERQGGGSSRGSGVKRGKVKVSGPTAYWGLRCMFLSRVKPGRL